MEYIPVALRIHEGSVGTDLEQEQQTSNFQINIARGTTDPEIDSVTLIELGRPVRWSFFRSDGMVNVFFQGTIGIDGFSMVLPALNHHH